MKRLFLLFVLTNITNIFNAQCQDYYNTDKVTGLTETYTVKHLNSGSCIVSNTKNQKIKQPLKYLDGTSVPNGYTPGVIPDDNSQLERAVKETFTSEEMQKLKATNVSLYIDYAIDPQTGKTIEVSFLLRNVPAYRAIPPTKLETLEKKIKQYMTWMISPQGKKVTHIIISTGYRYN